MKRVVSLVGLAFLIVAAPARAQQDVEWRYTSEVVRAGGTATNGNCEPSEFPLEIEIHFGPGNRVETVQGDQRTIGSFNPQTGRIRTSSGPESYTLMPDGKKGLTGFNTYDNCRWTIDFDLNKPGLVKVKAEAPEAAPSPTATPEATAQVPASDTLQDEGTGFPVPWWVIGAMIVFVCGGFLVYYNARRRAAAPAIGRGVAIAKGTPPEIPEDAGIEYDWRCKECSFEASSHEWSRDPSNALVCPNCGAQNTERVRAEKDD